jgi:hypothetical protein
MNCIQAKTVGDTQNKSASFYPADFDLVKLHTILFEVEI